MFSRLTAIASLLVAASVLSAAVAVAAGCPTFDGEKRLELIGRAPTCDKSMAVFEACSYGASGDVGLSAVVIKKCEVGFLAKLSALQRRQYDREQQHCVRKYEKESGTMYVSFAAFCAAELAQTYAHRYARGVKP